ncbi:Uncharacterised protein [uncultured Clostridium sp.]|uniref:DUF6442 family protein n=1 Tax=uncultured Clostridium sp. TaxID=59620 RepID=UPI0008216804|nr:DUF6442 family protein [uncultured Clostridium sp.]SCK01813.1 Uncharacterised protein [uncultured Clostridium sp.]
MDKEEILSKSRQEKKDEGVEFVENKGRKIGFTVFTCVYVFILACNVEMGRSSYEVNALLFTFLSSEAVLKYKFTHKNKYLIFSIVSIIITIFSLVKYIILLTAG